MKSMQSTTNNTASPRYALLCCAHAVPQRESLLCSVTHTHSKTTNPDLLPCGALADYYHHTNTHAHQVNFSVKILYID
jgi:hypothetical protein